MRNKMINKTAYRQCDVHNMVHWDNVLIRPQIVEQALHDFDTFIPNKLVVALKIHIKSTTDSRIWTNKGGSHQKKQVLIFFYIFSIPHLPRQWCCGQIRMWLYIVQLVWGTEHAMRRLPTQSIIIFRSFWVLTHFNGCRIGEVHSCTDIWIYSYLEFLIWEIEHRWIIILLSWNSPMKRCPDRLS